MGEGPGILIERISGGDKEEMTLTEVGGGN